MNPPSYRSCSDSHSERSVSPSLNHIRMDGHSSPLSDMSFHDDRNCVSARPKNVRILIKAAQEVFGSLKSQSGGIPEPTLRDALLQVFKSAEHFDSSLINVNERIEISLARLRVPEKDEATWEEFLLACSGSHATIRRNSIANLREAFERSTFSNSDRLLQVPKDIAPMLHMLLGTDPPPELVEVSIARALSVLGSPTDANSTVVNFDEFLCIYYSWFSSFKKSTSSKVDQRLNGS